MSNGTGALPDGWDELLEADKDESYSSKVIFSVALLVVFVVSCVANIVICIIIYCNKTMHTATDYYLFDLAVSDLLLTFQILIVVHENLAKNNNVMEYDNGRITCEIVICIQYFYVHLLWNHGILVMTALSIERYIAICYPFKLQRVPEWKRVVKIILVLWVIAIGETLPIFWTSGIIETEIALKCIFLPTLTTRIITVSSGVITFFIPLSIMIYVYTMISFRVKNHEKFNLSYNMVNKSIRNGKNVTNLIVALTTSFVVCWLPHFMFRMFIFFAEIKTRTHLELLVTLLRIAMFNSWFTTVLNPLLFSLISVKFRKAFKMMWDKLIKKRVKKQLHEEVEMQLRRNINV